MRRPYPRRGKRKNDTKSKEAPRKGGNVLSSSMTKFFKTNLWGTIGTGVVNVEEHQREKGPDEGGEDRVENGGGGFCNQGRGLTLDKARSRG